MLGRIPLLFTTFWDDSSAVKGHYKLPSSTSAGANGIALHFLGGFSKVHHLGKRPKLATRNEIHFLVRDSRVLWGDNAQENCVFFWKLQSFHLFDSIDSMLVF